MDEKEAIRRAEFSLRMQDYAKQQSRSRQLEHEMRVSGAFVMVALLAGAVSTLYMLWEVCCG